MYHELLCHDPFGTVVCMEQTTLTNIKYVLKQHTRTNSWELDTPPGATSWMPPHQVAMVLGNTNRITPNVAYTLIGQGTHIGETMWHIPTATMFPRLLNEALDTMAAHSESTGACIYDQLVEFMNTNGATILLVGSKADRIIPWIGFEDGSTITDQEILKTIYEATGAATGEADHAIVMAEFLAQDLAR